MRSTTRSAACALAILILPGRSDAQSAPAPAFEYFAPNFGISYQLVPYYGSRGARLTRYPAPGSPAAQLLLEPGDLIFEADGMRFFGPGDVNNHVNYTTLRFVNVRTNGIQSAAVYIPGAASPSPGFSGPMTGPGTGAGVGPGAGGGSTVITNPETIVIETP